MALGIEESTSYLRGYDSKLRADTLFRQKSAVLLEHPLNHSKRLGLIRLSERVFGNVEAIVRVCRQLNAWKSNDNIIAIWIEKDAIDHQACLLRKIDLESLEASHSLFKQIKYFSKPTIVWRDPLCTPIFNKLLDQGRFQLNNFSDLKSQSDSNASVFHSERPQYNKPLLLNSHEESDPLSCHFSKRSQILELLASTAWNDSACKDIEKCLIQLFSC